MLPRLPYAQQKLWRIRPCSLQSYRPRDLGPCLSFVRFVNPMPPTSTASHFSVRAYSNVAQTYAPVRKGSAQGVKDTLATPPNLEDEKKSGIASQDHVIEGYDSGHRERRNVTLEDEPEGSEDKVWPNWQERNFPKGAATGKAVPGPQVRSSRNPWDLDQFMAWDADYFERFMSWTQNRTYYDHPELDRLKNYSRVLSLPSIFVQHLLAKHKGTDFPSARPKSDVDIFIRKRLRDYGYKPEDLQFWSWILDAPDRESMVRRCILVQTAPIFLLREVLSVGSGKSQGNLSKDTFRTFLVHIWGRITRVDSTTPTSSTESIRAGMTPKDWEGIGIDELPARLQARLKRGRTQVEMDSCQNLLYLEQRSTLKLIQNLIFHARILSPSSLLSIANLSVHILETSKGRLHRRDAVTWVNKLIKSFRWFSQDWPLKNSIYNWKSQIALLKFCEKSTPPITLDRATFRSIAIVMAAQKQIALERSLAEESSRSWPPWRADKDVMALQRHGDTRTVSIIGQMRTDGFAFAPLDKALSILGGKEPDGTPTIPTRALLYVRDDELHSESISVYREWSARIRTTRDVQEAWDAFQSAKNHSVSPNDDMYFEMFRKLIMADVQQRRKWVHGAPAGDGREVLPPEDRNLSEYEYRRTCPPTLGQLYRQMIKDGLRPSGRILRLLVLNARSTVVATQYLQDGKQSDAISLLWGLDVPGEDGAKDHVPTLLIEAIIGHLCHMGSLIANPNSRYELRNKVINPLFEDMVIRKAFREFGCSVLPLVQAVKLVQSVSPAKPDVWRWVIKSLCSSTNLEVLKALPKVSLYSHHIGAFKVVQSLLESMKEANVRHDGEIFQYVCIVVEKALLVLPYGQETDVENLRRECKEAVVPYFKELSRAESSNYGLSCLLNQIHPVHLHHFVRVLGQLQDFEEILEVIRFITEYRQDLGHMVQNSANGVSAYKRVFAAARAFIDPLINPGEFEKMRNLLHSYEDTEWISWPSDEDVDEYVESLEANWGDLEMSLEQERSERAGESGNHIPKNNEHSDEA